MAIYWEVYSKAAIGVKRILLLVGPNRELDDEIQTA